MNKLLDEKVFKDPVHGFIKVSDELIWQLIQTPAFQRLRRIKQLGGTHMVFSSAEHSRFSHSLGVYYIAGNMIRSLSNHGIIFTNEERLLILCAALLHDLGHGPFSHAFESVLGVDHEEFTRKIILEDAKINEILENFKPGFSTSVSDVIAKKHANKLITAIISSQVDADRLDYLLRDSYFSGTTYGEIDLERILRTMRVKDGQIVFKHSGMHALEDYLFSRYQMFWQVYLHDCSRSFNLLIRALLQRVKFLIRTDYPFMCDVTLFKQLFSSRDVNVKTYLTFDDGYITTYATFFVNEDDLILKDLANRFLNRGLFDEFEYLETDDSEVLFQEIYQLLKISMINPDYYLFDDRHQQSTYNHFGMESEELIELLMPDGKVQEISKVSNIISGIVNAPKTKTTLFVPLDLIKKNENSSKIMKKIEKMIGSKLNV